MNNLWILTEERPKIEVLRTILLKINQDRGFTGFLDPLRIIPIIKDNHFTFIYEVMGIRCNGFDKVYLRIVSGSSSFVDYLVFLQEEEPSLQDKPIYAIEETKTDDKESRNTGVYQRCSKFVFIEHFYPTAKKIMLYNLQVRQKEKPTNTYIFGTCLLLNLGVEILGKVLDNDIFKPFTSIDELIDFKNQMRKAPKGNVPILISKNENNIEVSGRLIKSGRLAHDPNIGALSIICSILRKLGWEGSLIITQHGLKQEQIGRDNKFIQIADLIGIELEGLRLPKGEVSNEYWHYDLKGEKLGTIFLHLIVESFTQGFSIFENHAGCEKSYFFTKDREPIVLAKYQNKDLYKAGDKNQIIFIPDLILLDQDREQVINIEGKKYEFRLKGIKELANYDYIEEHYIKANYPEYEIIRSVVLYGGTEEQIVEVEVGFLLNKNGCLVLGLQAPELFEEAVTNLLNFWSNSLES